MQWLRTLFTRINWRSRKSIAESSPFYRVSTQQLIDELKHRSNVLVLVSIKWNTGENTGSENNIAIKGFEPGYMHALNMLHSTVAYRTTERRDCKTPCDLVINENKAE